MVSVAESCERQSPGVGAKRLVATSREGSAVALAKSGDSVLAYVADEDTRAIHTVNVDTKQQVARSAVDGAPAQVLVLEDGRVAVTLKNRNEVQILEPTAKGGLVSRCKRVVPTEPIGLAVTPDESTLLVTSGWGKALTALDAKTLSTNFAVDLPREPRAVLVDDDGQRAFVSHAVGAQLSVIDLKKGTQQDKVRPLDLSVKRASPFSSNGAEKPRGGAQGYALAKSVSGPAPAGGEKPPISGKAVDPLPSKPAPVSKAPQGRIFVPMVTVEPGDPNVRSQAYYGDARDGVPKEAPIVSVVDAAAERSMTRAVMSLGTPLTEECLLPRAAATRGSTGTLFITCLGVDKLLEVDTRGADPSRLERRRWSMPAGPTGVAVDDAGGRAIVWSQFEAKLSIVDIASPKKGEIVSVAVDYEPAPEVAAIARGRQLYHTTDDLRISNDGVACASCHPEGRDDAFTWSTPEGPRQTIMLAGRSVDTAPYGWQGKHGDLKTYLGNTFSRLGGSGVQGAELEALIAYLEKMPAPPEMVAHQESIAEGKELFHDASLGCASCHVGGEGVDKVTHDVGSKAFADLDVKFDTPSLRFIKGTAPYFHDGRYKTLEEMLSAADNEMGHTLHLTAGQRKALASYMETL
ncbi:MAG: c-type cytochrome [Myxococcales bacterium]|nr:c-type cytochrome [Myxococcales bacterium]